MKERVVSNEKICMTNQFHGGFGEAMDYTTLQWTSKPTRAYAVQESETLEDNSAWADVADYGLGANEATFKTGNTNGSEFYRIRASRPLFP